MKTVICECTCLYDAALTACPWCKLPRTDIVTESDWKECTYPNRMLNFLQAGGSATDRKLRLFACACSRRTWHLFDQDFWSIPGDNWRSPADERIKRAIQIAEDFADALVDPSVLAKAEAAVYSAYGLACSESFKAETESGKRALLAVQEALSSAGAAALEHMDQGYEAKAASVSASSAVSTAWGVSSSQPRGMILETAVRAAEEAAHASLLRDMFNPFYAACGDAPWRTPAVVAFAETIYTDRSFDWLPELARRLSLAGCTDSQLLEHLCAQTTHLRGCWALDFVLEKK